MNRAAAAAATASGWANDDGDDADEIEPSVLVRRQKVRM